LQLAAFSVPVQQPSPQTAEQSASQLQAVSSSSQTPSPQQAPGQSIRQLQLSSVPVQQPSPQMGVQSDPQLQGVSAPVQEPSPQQSPGQSPGQLHVFSDPSQMPSPQQVPGQSARQLHAFSPPLQQPSPHSRSQSPQQPVSSCVQQPSPQKGSQFCGQLHAFSRSLQPLPQFMQSFRQLLLVSSPVQHQSPQTGGQSSGQLHARSLPLQTPSPQFCWPHPCIGETKITMIINNVRINAKRRPKPVEAQAPVRLRVRDRYFGSGRGRVLESGMRRTVLTIALCLGFACSKKEATPPPPATTEAAGAPATPQSPATPTPPKASGRIVELISPGSAPRQILRWKFVKGDRQDMSMTMNMAMGMEMGGRTMPKVQSPPMVIDMQIAIVEELPAGGAKAEFTLVKMAVEPTKETPPQLVEPMKAALGMVKDLKGTYTVDARGFVSEATLAAPDTAPPQVRQALDGVKQSMNQMIAPLPEEPVGVGAKWAIRTAVNQGGIKMTQATNMEILEIEGNRVDVKITIEQSAPAQSIAPPGAPPGQTVDLVSLESSGGGEATWDLTKTVPSKANVSTSVAMHMRAPGPDGQKQEMKMAMDMSVAITGK